MNILVINPGSTSTKVAIYKDENLFYEKNIKHPKEEIVKFKDLFEEKPYREKAIIEALSEENIDISFFDAFAGRGGTLKPLKAGVYRVTESMIDDINKGNIQQIHASLLGALIAYDFSLSTGKPAFIVDPISSDEMADIAKIAGHPKIKFAALTHTLNVRACARKVSKDLNLDFFESNFIIAHLGGGITVNAIYKGKIIDVLDGRQTGPFAPTSCGALPLRVVAKLIIKGELKVEEIEDLYGRSGGLVAYFGTDDVKELLSKSEQDEKIKQVLQAMCFQVAKAINAQKTILKGEYETIVLTGGLAYSEILVGWIKSWFPESERFYLVPGEHEMEALAFGTLRALKGEENVLDY
jgi:butyrate kinase